MEGQDSKTPIEAVELVEEEVFPWMDFGWVRVRLVVITSVEKRDCRAIRSEEVGDRNTHHSKAKPRRRIKMRFPSEPDRRSNNPTVGADPY